MLLPSSKLENERVGPIAVSLLAVALAPLLSARRIRRMDIPSTLRVVE